MVDGNAQQALLSSKKVCARTLEPKRGPGRLTMNTQRLNEIPISVLKVISSRKNSMPAMNSPLL